MPETPRTVKSYAEISLEAMKRRLEGQYRFWLLARHLDPEGGGRVMIRDLRQFLVRHNLCDRKTLHRALRHPSIFWTTYSGVLKLVSVLKVADELGVELRRRPVLLPLAAFASMKDLRDVFVASYLSGKPRTFAIQTLAELTGRTRRSVSRYLESRRVGRTPNAMTSVRRPSRYLHPDLAKQGYFHTRVKGRWILVKRMPNTYQTDLETAPRGMTVKQTRRSSFSTEQSPSSEDEPPSSPEEGACSGPRGMTHRLYYRKPQAANRALQSLSPGETVYTLSSGRHDDLGFQLWRGWTIPFQGGPIGSL